MFAGTLRVLLTGDPSVDEARRRYAAIVSSMFQLWLAEAVGPFAPKGKQISSDDIEVAVVYLAPESSNVDDITFIAVMNPGQDDCYMLNAAQIKAAVAVAFYNAFFDSLTVAEQEALDLKSYQIDTRFMVMSGVVLRLKAMQPPAPINQPGSVVSSWGGEDLSGLHVRDPLDHVRYNAPSD